MLCYNRIQVSESTNVIKTSGSYKCIICHYWYFSEKRFIRMQEIRSSNPPMVTGICDPNKSRARHHRSFKLGSKLKYLNSEKV